MNKDFAAEAQLAEQWTFNPLGVGANPTGGTSLKLRGVTVSINRFERFGDGAIPSAAATIRKLLLQNKPWKQICLLTGRSKRTVAYHAKRLRNGKLPKNTGARYKWDAISKFSKENSREATVKHFGLSKSAVRYAVRKGIIARIQRIPQLEAVMVKGSNYGRKNLKKRIIKLELIPYLCAVCGSKPEWNGRPLSLRLDHINGVKDDHRIENLRFVCPNCDSQLPTFCSRNIQSMRRKNLQTNALMM